MGRASRERRRRKKRSLKDLIIMDETEIFNNMEEWMLSLDWFPVCELTPTIFPVTGRGLMCLDNIQSGDILVKIPRELLITTSVVRNSRILKIFHSDESYEAHCILAVFLAYERHLGKYSKWKSYLDSLPRSHSNPDFCTTREKKLLSLVSIDPEIRSNKVRKNYRSVVGSLSILKKLNEHLCPHCSVSLYEIITFASFKWAYYTVNTRAVYIDSKENFNDYIRVRDLDNMALAPFLDLFNHSYDASVQVGLVYDNENREYYQIKTSKSFPRGSQVFINYGSHDSLRLFTEYGFFIPNNPLDQVSFDLSHIQRFTSIPPTCRDFIVSHGFDRNMAFISQGLTYNAKIVLFILSTRSAIDEWRIKVYSGEFSSKDLLGINSFGRKILDVRKSELAKQLDSMRAIVGGTESFKIATELVREYVNLLNRSLVQLSASDIDHSTV